MVDPADGARAYADGSYVASLAEFGDPLHLPRSGGWLLARGIPGTGHRDLMGPYPLFSCASWSALAADLDGLADGGVSVVTVADPLGDWDLADLRAAFPDHLTAFKRHLVRDLSRPAALPAHHRRRLAGATRSVQVELCPDPVQYLDDWVSLYAGLVGRRRLVGISAFSAESFRRQLTAPGMLAFRAVRDGVTVAMTLWLTGADTAYYHLGASSAAGYEVSASYALFAAALEHLGATGIRRVDLGGVAGAQHREDGLFRFKAGWANDERPAYLCGRIIDRRVYAALSPASGTTTTWFPAYRAPGARTRTAAVVGGGGTS